MASQFTDGDLDRFITIAEAAARLRVGRSTAYEMIHAGTFPAPIQIVAGKQVVSLRLLTEFIHAPEAMAS